ncbi:retrovirus-related Pol polyprotein from transposon 297 [Trichonephila clavipes]|nr:retrovirus-related Pol polyprotein from transposon 297 [Trichonephila clavipes]
MIRWALKLSEFNIEWEHRPGSQNVVTDVLSRNPVDNVEGSQISCAALRALALNSRERIIQEQREDPELGHMYCYLENPDDGSVNATVCEDLLAPYPASRPERYRYILVITDHFSKWSELIPLRKTSSQAIAKALFENYTSRYGTPFSLISDIGPQFISDVFEHFSHRLDIKHIKTVSYRLQANLTERVNRTLVQMIASFVEENHDNWDRFLHEFSFLLRTAVDETTGPYGVLEVINNNLTIWKRGRKVTVNVDQVRFYHPRNYDTSNYDSINETIYDGKESSNWSNRSNSEKSRRSRKPSGNENKSVESDKGNAGLVDLRVKRDRAVESSGTSERYDRKRPKICRKRSFRGSDYEQHRKRKEPKILPGTSNQGQKRRSNPPKQKSSRKTRVESDRTRETRTSTDKGHSAAEGRPVRTRRKPTVKSCPYYLRSRFKQPERLPEEHWCTGIDSLPQNSLRRRSLSMKAEDGDPGDKST